MDYEIWMFIRNLMITLFVIAIPLSIMGLVKYTYKRRALAVVNTMPSEIQNLLRHPAVCKEASGIQRLKYIRKSIIFGILIFVIVIGYDLLRTMWKGAEIDGGMYAVMSVVLLTFILAFVLRDILRVAPWSEAYQIKAVTCFATGDGRECFVCYYDFADGDYSAGGIPISRWKKSSIQGGQVVDVLAVIKGNKVKVIDIL